MRADFLPPTLPNICCLCHRQLLTRVLTVVLTHSLTYSTTHTHLPVRHSFIHALIHLFSAHVELRLGEEMQKNLQAFFVMISQFFHCVHSVPKITCTHTHNTETHTLPHTCTSHAVLHSQKSLVLFVFFFCRISAHHCQRFSSQKIFIILSLVSVCFPGSNQIFQHHPPPPPPPPHYAYFSRGGILFKNR